MIRIFNETDRRRSYRVKGERTVWIEPKGYADVDADMPPKSRVRAFAVSGLRIKPSGSRAESAQDAFHDPEGGGSSGEGREIAPLPGSTGPASGSADPGSVNIPADWELMPYPLLREIAGKLDGNPVRSRASAVTIIRAELDRRGEDPAATPAAFA